MSARIRGHGRDEPRDICRQSFRRLDADDTKDEGLQRGQRKPGLIGVIVGAHANNCAAWRGNKRCLGRECGRAAKRRDDHRSAHESSGYRSSGHDK